VNSLFTELSDAVVNMDEDAAVAAAKKVLAQGVDPYLAITEGLSAGMRRVGDLYERGEYFVPEILMCSDAMNAAIAVLRPHIKSARGGPRVKVIIGVIEGDIHDIGKNIVKIMLDAAGYDVIDLGRDVSPEKFVEAARQAGSGLIGLSTLMSTTMENMGKVVRLLEREGLRDRFRVMIGGGPVSELFAREIGADGCGRNAKEAVDLADRLSREIASCPATA